MTAYYGPSKFTYDSTHDRYICPNGQPLHLWRMEYKVEKAEYRADPATCNACPLKAQCTPSDQGRQVHRSFHASYLERVRSYHQTEAYDKAMRKRKVWVEPLFAEAKDWHGLRRFRLRLLWRVNIEALRTATGQNLKRLLKKRGWGRRPFPTEAVATLPPAQWEPDAFPRQHLLKSYRLSAAVASLITRWPLSPFFACQTCLFSLIISNYVFFLYNNTLYFKTSYFVSYSSFAFLSLSWRIFA